MANLQVGTKVICNGYDGTVVEVCIGQVQGMAVVRVPGGRTCVSITELRQWSECDRFGAVINQDWYGSDGWNRS